MGYISITSGYGLIVVVAAGWAGIVYGLPAYKRIYAVAFGVGAGLNGDEIGLLLTFRDYNEPRVSSSRSAP